jgi:hypothetical protein
VGIKNKFVRLSVFFAKVLLDANLQGRGPCQQPELDFEHQEGSLGQVSTESAFFTCSICTWMFCFRKILISFRKVNSSEERLNALFHMYRLARCKAHNGERA